MTDTVQIKTGLLRNSTSLVNADYIPSNWYIEPTKTGITARNNITGSTFEGTIEEFNNALRNRYSPPPPPPKG